MEHMWPQTYSQTTVLMCNACWICPLYHQNNLTLKLPKMGRCGKLLPQAMLIIPPSPPVGACVFQKKTLEGTLMLFIPLISFVVTLY